jgi:hypothetical protein
VTHPEHDPPTSSGYPSIATTVAGAMLVVAGMVVLGFAVLPQVVPTIGPEPLTFWPVDEWSLPADGTELGLLFGSLVLPASGFGLAYRDAGPAARRWISAACTLLFLVQGLLLAAAVLWMTGLGLGANTIIDAPRDSYAVAVIAPLCLLVCAAASAILNVLGRRSTFDARSAEYSTTGSAVVRITPLSLPAHALWLLLAVASWAVIVFVPLAAVARVAGMELPFAVDPTQPRPWPDRADDDFGLAQVVYGATAGIVTGAVASSLLKKVLYRTVLRGTVGRAVTDATANNWRSIQPFVHYPLALAGLAATVCVLVVTSATSSGSPVDSGVITLFTVLGGLATVTGVVLVVNIWKTGDDPLRDLPIQQAVPGDPGRSFRTPAKRRRGR